VKKNIYFFLISIIISFTTCRNTTKRELLENKWQLEKVSFDRKIKSNSVLTKWLDEQNAELIKNTAVTEYSDNGYFLCYTNNRLLDGENKNKGVKDTYRLTDEKEEDNANGTIILIHHTYENGKTDIIKEKILYLSKDRLVIKSYEAKIIKFTKGNCFVFIYRRYSGEGCTI